MYLLRFRRNIPSFIKTFSTIHRLILTFQVTDSFVRLRIFASTLNIFALSFHLRFILLLVIAKFCGYIYKWNFSNSQELCRALIVITF